MKITLSELDKTLKRFLTTFVVVLSFGVIIGLIYLRHTTSLSPTGAVEQISGTNETELTDDFDIPEKYPKTISELLITTHNHIISFAFIFFLLGGIFYFNSIVKGFWKTFLMIEPLISILITFGSIWGMRYLSESFVFLAVISSSLIYLSFFIMTSLIIFELNFKKSQN
jgi:hypothetical protein